MTVAPLTITPTGWVGAAMVGLRNAMDPQAMSGAASRAEVAQMHQLEAMQAARKMALLRRIEETEVAKNSGATSTSSMLAGDFGGDQAAASRQVRTAQNLKVATQTESALAGGEISFEKASVMPARWPACPSTSTS